MAGPLICVGILAGPHGVRGQVRLRSLTQDPAALFSYGALTDKTGGRSFKIKKDGKSKDCFIVSIEGIDDRDAAEKLKKTELFVDRAVLPPPQDGEYYLTDLIGLEARSEKEDITGTIEKIHDYGAGIFLEIKPPHAKSFMLPFKDEFVPMVDIEKGFVTIIIPDDWLKEEK
ncbi:MAG TPA: 16S rRNA processing protein RimM [Rhodospirillaceae bacterium]|nr:16S rRNA processing protein RimM [Rhodospirillaceae bacterium]